jgi:hypothetical protein
MCGSDTCSNLCWRVQKTSISENLGESHHCKNLKFEKLDESQLNNWRVQDLSRASYKDLCVEWTGVSGFVHVILTKVFYLWTLFQCSVYTGFWFIRVRLIQISLYIHVHVTSFIEGCNNIFPILLFKLNGSLHISCPFFL